VRLGPKALLALAGGCAFVFVLDLVAAYSIGPARYVDAAALDGFVSFDHARLEALAVDVAHLGNPAAVGLLGLGIAALALARGRPRLALAVVALLAATSISSQLLKALLAHPRPTEFHNAADVGAAAYPSGHSTAAMAIALALVMATPSRLRPLAAFVGLGFALAVGFAMLIDGGHFPSDVLGGYLLAAGWTFAVAATVRWADERWPERSSVATAVRRAAEGVEALGLGAIALGGALLAGLAALTVVVTRLPDAIGYADRHTSSVVVATGLAVAAAALTSLVTVALLRRP
jgi:membrane-associated phospholipid phosphatase